MTHLKNNKLAILCWAILTLSIGNSAMTQESLFPMVVKLTYTGPQNKIIPSLIIKEAGYEFPIKKFSELNLNYPNDEDLSQTFSVSHKTMEKIGAAISEKMIEKKIAEENPVLTIIVLHIDSDKYKRIILSKSEAVETMSRIHDVVSGEANMSKALEIWLVRTDLKKF